MLAGPSIATCFNSSDGMGICLRGKMTDAGLLGPQPTVAAQPSVTTQATEVEVAVATPQLDVTPPPAEPATPTPPSIANGLIAATFGLLRAEPDGSVVIAGSGTPGTEVEVYSNGELLGTAKVEPSGDWVLVPDEPIAPGGTELTLAENGKQGQSAESFVVVINDDKTSEPLVVASTPGQASEILQGLARPDLGRTTDVAVADPVSPPAVTVQPEAPAAVATSPTPTPTPATAPSTSIAAPVAPTEPAVETPTVAAPAQPTPTPPEPSVAAAPIEPSTAPAASAEPAPTPTPAVPDQQVAVAAPVQATPAAPAAVLANVPPTIDAIEIEETRNFFAGGGPDGAIMRLYVDGQYIADATVDAGRWLVESANVLTKPTQRIRIDMLAPGSAEVAARAEVDFVVDLPEPETPTAVAAAQPTLPAEAVPAPTPPVPATDAPAFAAAAPQPAADQPATSAVEPAPTEPTTPAITAEATPAPTPTTPPVASVPEPAASTPTVPAQTVEAPKPAVNEPAPTAVAEAASSTTEPSTPTDASVPTLVAVAVGEPGDQRFASGKAIIRRGDNLWTIARRVYGQGIKYTTIYAANDGQIRNPNRIYPGQVFDLPTSAD